MVTAPRFLLFLTLLTALTCIGQGPVAAAASDFKIDAAEVAIPFIVRPLTEISSKDLVVQVDRREVQKKVIPLTLPWEVNIVLDVSGSMVSLVRKEDFREKITTVIRRLVDAGLSNMLINVFTSANNLTPYLTHVAPQTFKFPHVVSGGSTSVTRDLLQVSRAPLNQKFAGKIVIAITDGIDYGFSEFDLSNQTGAFQGNNFLVFVDISKLPESKAHEKYLNERIRRQFGKTSDDRAEKLARRKHFIDLVNLSYGEYLYPSSEQDMVSLVGTSMANILSATHLLFINQNEFKSKTRQTISIQKEKQSSLKMISPLRKNIFLSEVDGQMLPSETSVDWEPEIDFQRPSPSPIRSEPTALRSWTMDLSSFAKPAWNNAQSIVEFHPHIVVEGNSMWLRPFSKGFPTALEFELQRTANTLSTCNIVMSKVEITVSEDQLLPTGIPRDIGELKNAIERLVQAHPNLQQPAIYYAADPVGTSVMGVAVRNKKPLAPKEGWIFISDSSLGIYKRRSGDNEGGEVQRLWVGGGFTTLHEFGHLYGGLEHTLGSNIMSGNAASVNNDLSKAQCESLRDGIPRASNR